MKTDKTFAGIWLEEGAVSLREDLPVPALAPGEALIRPRLAGVCSTDLELIKGYYPYTGVPGHEFVGEVVRCPDNPTLDGQRVVGEINAPCHACPTCLRAQPTHCPQRTVLGIVNRPGVFGQLFTLPAKNLLPVPDDLPDRAAVFAEPLAAALQIQQQVHIPPGHRVLLVGAGRLGQLIARVLRLSGCELMVLEPRQSARLLLSGLGITLLEQPPPEPVDLVVEATGTAAGFEVARRHVRPRGTIVAKSTYHGRLELDYSSLVVDEITLIGSRCGPMAPAVRLMAEGRIDPTPLISARFPLERGLAALDEAEEPGSMKVLIEVN